EPPDIRATLDILDDVRPAAPVQRRYRRYARGQQIGVLAGQVPDQRECLPEGQRGRERGQLVQFADVMYGDQELRRARSHFFEICHAALLCGIWDNEKMYRAICALAGAMRMPKTGEARLGSIRARLVECQVL